MTAPRVLVTGGTGLLGRALVPRLEAAGAEVVAPSRAVIDLGDPTTIDAAMAALAPSIVIHTAGLTSVDGCDRDAALAWRLNADACGVLARACQRSGARLIAISSDYVFSGEPRGDDRAYHEGDAPGPRTVYGASKRAGELAVIAGCDDHLIVRVSWLFGRGSRGFVEQVRALGRQDGLPLRAAHDQRSAPTSADAAADAIVAVLREPRGVLHVAGAGEATRLELAETVLALTGARRTVESCLGSELGDLVTRPRDTRMVSRRLEDLGVRLPPWRDALARHLDSCGDDD